jgi:membrane-bound metal-dependent hydrolase YbcI (DUF457 family)
VGETTVLARSHVILAVAPYLALLGRPLPATSPLGPLAVPVLRLPSGEAPADPVLAVALSVALVALAALAPDLDHAGSMLGRVAGPASRVAARAVERLLGHPGPLHSLLAVAVAGGLGELLGAHLGVAGLGLLVSYGWASHVLADGLTDRGVPLLWPLWRRRVRLPFGLGPATGGPGEALAVGAGLLLCGRWVALGATP